jgi:hypothetical protein
LRGGIGIGARAALFENDVALGQDDLVRQDKARHAVGLEFHDCLQRLFRHALVIGGVVVGGEGVLLAAEFGHRVRELARRMCLGSLEHQMFEEMRDAGFSALLVGRADAVPDHVGHDGSAPVRHDNDIETVRERKGFDFGAGHGPRFLRRGAGSEGSAEESGTEKRMGHEFYHYLEGLGREPAEAVWPTAAIIWGTSARRQSRSVTYP